MKNLLSILLITIYLFGNTEIGQLLNINQLLDHYQQHHAADPKLCFMKFITMHYCSDDGTAADDVQDGKLPFRQIHQFNFIFFTAPAENKFTAFKSYPVKKEMNDDFSLQDVEPVYLNNPIQPPRFIS